MNARANYTTGTFENRPFAKLGKSQASSKETSSFYSGASLPRLSQTEEDGVHHINVGSNSVTELGYNLSIDAETRFNHPDFGSFATVRGFSHWIKSMSFDDTYRNLQGKNLLTYFKENTDDQYKLVENYTYHLAHAIWQKVSQNKRILHAMRESTLPFEMYHRTPIDRGNPNAGFTRIRDKTASWIIPIMDTIRKALKAKTKTEPNFDFLIYNVDTIGVMKVNWETHKQARVAANNVPTFVQQQRNKAGETQAKQKQENGELKQFDQVLSQEEVIPVNNETVTTTVVAVDEPAHEPDVIEQETVSLEQSSVVNITHQQVVTEEASASIEP